MVEREEKADRLSEKIKREEERERLEEKLVRATAQQMMCPLQKKPCDVNCAWFCREIIKGHEVNGCALTIIVRRLEVGLPETTF